jgi:hypothetical protein
VVVEAVVGCGKQARRSDGKLPPHVMLYYVMALALFADEDYEEVLSRLAQPLTRRGCWDAAWQIPGSSGITQARQRLGHEVLARVFEQVAEPVADTLTRGAWLAGRRLVSIDGFEWDVPDTAANAAEFGYPGGAKDAAFPKARVLTLAECASRATLAAHIGPIAGKGSGERSAAPNLFARLEPDMLLLADRGFYSFALWCQAADTGANLLWRIGDSIELPTVSTLADGSYLSVLFDPKLRAPA